MIAARDLGKRVAEVTAVIKRGSGKLKSDYHQKWASFRSLTTKSATGWQRDTF